MAKDLRTGQSSCTISFRFDGREIPAREGDNVAVALWAAGIRQLRRGPGDGMARGMFCTMGICQECAVVIDGRVVEACRTPVTPSLDVNSIQ